MKTLTNKPKAGSSLDFPEDFRAACLIHQLSHESLLQHFIDNMSICSSFLPPVEAYKACPVEVVHQYLDTLKESDTPAHTSTNRAHSIRFLRDIGAITQATGIRQKAKNVACNNVIERWYKTFDRKIVLSDHLRVGEISLKLSKDFILLCEVFQVRPEEILQHFVNQISLPWAKAQTAPQSEEGDNPAMAFFIETIGGKTGIYKGRYALKNPEVHVAYIEQLQELDLQLRFESDAKKREKMYWKLYRAWYQALVAAQVSE